MLEQGRPQDIAATIRASDIPCKGSSFDVEEYMQWAPQVYNFRPVKRWEPLWWMTEEFSGWTPRISDLLIKVYGVIKSERLEEYVPVRWMTATVSWKEITEFPLQAMQDTGLKALPLYYFALGHKRDKYILYAKESFLMTYQSGRDIINYYRTATRYGNFHRIYGF